MSDEISLLEQAWLEAETMAERAKREAQQASDELARRNGKSTAGPEVKVLLTTVETAKARQEEAERMATAAFDRLWQAKEQGSVHA